MSHDARLEQRQTFLRQHANADPDALQKAGQDAGARCYWRLDGSDAVLMDAPPEDNDLGTWLDVHALLDAGGVRVPRILARDLAHGFLLLEDLGRNTLLDSISNDNADAWFEVAITQLLRIQAITPPASLPPYDAALLGRELDLFADWFIATELDITLDRHALTAWQDACRYLIEQALAQPTVLVHRDFMPRNLMPIANELAVIDFQDAVSGPMAYDPLCLFKDAFVSWPQARIDAWLRQYHERALRAGLAMPDWNRFMRDVDLIGVQRHLKVIGIFARLKHRDGKLHYLDDAPRFMAYLDQVLPHHPELAPLQALLQQQLWPVWHEQSA